MVQYKLIYFDLMGRGETPRLMLKTAGIEFEDVRIPIEKWPELKKTFVHGLLPVLEVDGKQLIQTFAICRYIAREAGFYGDSNWESSRIDAICDTVRDYEPDIDRLWDEEETKEVKAFVKKRYEEVKIPRIFGILETLLKENNDGNGFFVGEKISMADFVVYSFIDVLVRTHFTFEEPTGFPKLTAHLNRMNEVPQIKEWIKVRPKTQY